MNMFHFSFIITTFSRSTYLPSAVTTIREIPPLASFQRPLAHDFEKFNISLPDIIDPSHPQQLRPSVNRARSGIKCLPSLLNTLDTASSSLESSARPHHFVITGRLRAFEAKHCKGHEGQGSIGAISTRALCALALVARYSSASA